MKAGRPRTFHLKRQLMMSEEVSKLIDQERAKLCLSRSSFIEMLVVNYVQHNGQEPKLQTLHNPYFFID